MERAGNKRIARGCAAIALAITTTLAAGAFGSTAGAATSVRMVLTRSGAPGGIYFRTTAPGEVLVDITAYAPGVSWGSAKATSAVVKVSVDGVFKTDDVVMEATAITRTFDLGSLAPGVHKLRLQFDTNASSPGATKVYIERALARTVTASNPDYVELRHSPVLYGRNLASVNGGAGGPYQNAATDSPLVAWHESTPAATPGHRILEYSIVWSNEDGGTAEAALMARWGRATDIEWIYRVEVDASGNRVAGTAVFQSPAHGTQQFAGTYEGDHPRLQTCTSNNNVCDTVNDPMRFTLGTTETLDAATQAREQVMDANPWTYRIMSEEAVREGRVVANPDPAQSKLIADPRDYLYTVIRKQTTGAVNNGTFFVGVAIGVRLKNDATLYRSDFGVHPDWSLQRDAPAATTVRLPHGTTAADISEIDAIRVPFGPDNGATVNIQAINRTFFLASNYQPHASFFSGSTPRTLTVASPTAVLYTAP